MAQLSRSVAALRILGDELVPGDITALLGGEPTASAVKGGQKQPNSGGRVHTALTGSWMRTVEDREPADGDAQIASLLEGLTTDLRVWQELAARFRVDLFFGLFLSEGNEGFSLAPSTLAALGERGIKLDLDIYSARATD
jgi:hypothetical protein